MIAAGQAPRAASACPSPAKLALFLVVEATGSEATLLPIGVYCAPHFHRERDGLKLAGKRTGVEVLEQDGVCFWVGP